VLEASITELGQGLWESQVKVSDDIIVEAIIARGRGIIQVSNDIINFSKGNWFIC
jgi:hypothetical protein